MSAEHMPWYHLIARIRPHEPVDTSLAHPQDLGRALRDVFGNLDLDDVLLLPEPAAARADAQVWERRLVGTDVAETRLHLVVDATGRTSVHEAVLVQLLTDAGWERTA